MSTVKPVFSPPRSYVLISPCRNEADYMRTTLDSVIAQNVRPSLWIIVDDGSTDMSLDILQKYSGAHDWIRVVQKPDRGHRAVGPGVIEAFYAGYNTIDPTCFTYLCKLDLDLDLPPRYFETLIELMESNPRIGSCSGKPYIRRGETLVSERRGDEMSAGMTKFYRRECFDDIGGFVHAIMWDAIDCHKARQRGWITASWDIPELRFEHLRPMGSSQVGIHTGRRRHGFGQYYMGSDFLYFAATCIFRMTEPPYITGGLSMMHGYLGAWLKGVPQHNDPSLRRFIRQYQRRALVQGKKRATQLTDAAQAHIFDARISQTTREHKTRNDSQDVVR